MKVECGGMGKKLHWDQRKFWRVMNMFTTLLVVVVVLWMYKYVKTYQILYFKYTHFMTSYLNRAVKNTYGQITSEKKYIENFDVLVQNLLVIELHSI